MSNIFFRKKRRIQQLETEIWFLKLRLERQDYGYQLTVPTLEGDIRFSGSQKAIEELKKFMDFEYTKRKVGQDE